MQTNESNFVDIAYKLLSTSLLDDGVWDRIHREAEAFRDNEEWRVKSPVQVLAATYALHNRKPNVLQLRYNRGECAVPPPAAAYLVALVQSTQVELRCSDHYPTIDYHEMHCSELLHKLLTIKRSVISILIILHWIRA